MKHLFTFDHVDCGHCASQIEEDLNRQEFVFQARMNFMTKKLMVDSKVQDSQELLAMILPVAQKHAPGIVLATQNTQVTRWQFEGIDCGSCALEIEEDLKKLEGIDDVQMNFLREQMTLTTSQEVDQGLLDTIHQVGRKVEPEARFFSEAEAVGDFITSGAMRQTIMGNNYLSEYLNLYIFLKVFVIYLL